MMTAWGKLGRRLGTLLLSIATGLLLIWATAAIYLDAPIAVLRPVLAIAFVGWSGFVLWRFKLSGRGVGLVVGSALVVILWWLTLRPTNDRNWQPDVARLASAKVQGDLVTIQNVRDFHYESETSFTPRWKPRIVDLREIRGVDVYISHWGVPLISHAIVSFGFADGTYLAMSIEARKVVGQEYSAIRGFFRQFEMIYLPAEERDVIRLRTNFRGEDVYLYHTLTTSTDAKALFMQYMSWINASAEHPEWYNALTNNCARPPVDFLARTGIGGISSYDWRTILSGSGDEMLYELGDLAGNLPFPELKRRALITEAAKNASEDDFSRAIRVGRPGF